MPAQFDFREGIIIENIVYKDTSCDWESKLLYISFLLLTWAYGIAWFALFFYCYIFHERTTFWVFIGCWFVHIGVLIGKGTHTIIKAKQNKQKNKRLQIEIIAQQEKIEQLKLKLNEEEEKETDPKGGDDEINSLN
jgi:hypothetical protein